MKTCRTCGRDLQINDFYVHHLTSDGRLNHCKACVKERMRNHQRGNPEVAARDRERHQRNPEIARAAKARWHKRNPEKRRAQRAVKRAIDRGEIVRGSCEVCGKPNAEAHHDDYTNPLQVRWLCRQHHAEFHRKPSLVAF